MTSSSDSSTEPTITDKQFTSEKTYVILNIFGYSLLIIATITVGLNITDGYFSKSTSKKINYYATFGLVIVWILFLAGESIKLHKNLV